jgi:general secretion pathway protein C
LGAAAAPAGNAVAVDAVNGIRLTGIIASAGGQGVALLSIDGKPPRPYRVGSTLEEGLVLQSVESRRVALSGDAEGPVRMHLELPTRH